MLLQEVREDVRCAVSLCYVYMLAVGCKYATTTPAASKYVLVVTRPHMEVSMNTACSK